MRLGSDIGKKCEKKVASKMKASFATRTGTGTASFRARNVVSCVTINKQMKDTTAHSEALVQKTTPTRAIEPPLAMEVSESAINKDARVKRKDWVKRRFAAKNGNQESSAVFHVHLFHRIFSIGRSAVYRDSAIIPRARRGR